MLPYTRKLHSTAGWNILVELKVCDTPVQAVVDTASQVTIMNRHTFEQLGLPITGSKDITLKTATESKVRGYLVHNVPVALGTKQFTWDIVVAPITDPVILGLDFLLFARGVIDLEQNVLKIGNENIPACMKRNDSGNSISVCRVTLNKTTRIPANSCKLVKIELHQADENEDYAIDPLEVHPFIALPSVVVKGGTSASLYLANFSNKTVQIHHSQLLGCATPCNVDESEQHPEEPTEEADPSRNESGPSNASETNYNDSVLVRSVALEHDHHAYEQLCSDMPEHLKDLFNRSCANLDDAESLQVGKLLLEFQDAFAKHDLDLGHFELVQHRINTGDAQPRRQRMRRTPVGFQKEEQQHLQAMLDQGVIEPSESEWAAAPVLVRKRDGSIRYCIDYRDLNECTVKDAFPLPLIEECLDTLSGTLYMSCLDMASGYWQICIHPDDRHKTAFITKYGLYQMVRLAFGLCNSPGTFQRVMNFVLRGLIWEGALVYLDDVMVMGKSFTDHLSNLREVLSRFKQYNLKLKPRKCHLFKTEVEFLGKKVGRDGISVTEAKVKAVVDWPIPVNKEQVQAFLGFVNYNRDFIEGFAHKAASLYEITGQKDFIWGESQDKAFQDLKQAMVTSPVLAYPNSEDTFILDTDASDRAVGAVLSQIQQGEERTIAYASHALDKCQLKYCTTRKELLAVVKFTRHFRHYLLGKPFIVRTDHHSLVWLTRFKHIEGQLARWLEELSQYDMRIIHRAGRSHLNADGMSRIPDEVCSCDCYDAGKTLDQLPCGGCKFCIRAHNQWSRFHQDVDDVVPLSLRAVGVVSDDTVDNDHSWFAPPSAEQLREFQLGDPHLKPVIKWLENRYDPNPQELFLTSRVTKHLWLCRPHLTLKGGILYYHWVGDDRLKLVVPDGLQQEMVRLAHDVKTACHPGIDKTLLRLKRSVFWPNMTRDVKLYVNTCDSCIKSKKPKRKPKAALGGYHAGVPMERVHMDLLGPLPPSEMGNRYILVLVDQFTKWVECFPLVEQTAERVASLAVNEFFLRLGLPFQIHTDQGKQFEGKLFHSLCDLLEVAKTRTTPYHPCSNGQVERINRTILQSIRCYLDGVEKEWDKYLPFIAASIRASVNRTTGFSPNLMMLGREVTSPLEMVTNLQTTEGMNPASYVSQLLQNMDKVHELARKSIRASVGRQKRTYDVKLYEHQYSVGDFVYQYNSASKEGESRKLRPVCSGPLLVTAVLSPVTYKVEGRRRSQVLHHDKIRPYTSRTVPLWIKRKRHRLLSMKDNMVSDSREASSDDSPLPLSEASDDDSPPPLLPEKVKCKISSPKHSISSSKQRSSAGKNCTPEHGESDIPEQQSSSGRRLHRPSYLKDYK